MTPYERGAAELTHRLAIAVGMACLLLLTAGAAPAVEPSATPIAVPRLEIEAPPQLAAEAERLRAVPASRLATVAELVGLAYAGEPIQVILADEDSEAAQSTPPWISGYAYGALGTVVLLPRRDPGYPDSSLDELLLHEIAHVLVHRAAGNRSVPRWFNEGVAMLAAGQWGFEDRSRLTLALVFARRPAIASLDEAFGGGAGEVHRAYALAGALVREVYRLGGRRAAARILGRVAVGIDFDEALMRSTGLSARRFEEEFWKRHSIWYRWLPIASSSLTLWLIITALALWAAKRRRDRRLQLERMWDLEDRLAESRRWDETVH